jgi:hypothetical protein
MEEVSIWKAYSVRVPILGGLVRSDVEIEIWDAAHCMQPVISLVVYAP